MADDAENHTIKLLQEMRSEMNARFDQIDKRFDDVDERFDGVDARIDGVTHIMTLLAAHGYSADERIEDLEEAVADLREE